MTMTKGKTPPPKKKKGPALRVITSIGDSAFSLGAFIEYHVNNIDLADTVVSYTAVRQELLDAIHRSEILGREYVLRPAPIISASQTYHLGSVFVADEYPLRHTPNCHVPEDKLNPSVPMNEIPSFRQARAFDPRADISHLLRRAAGQSPKVQLSLGLNKEVTFRYSEGTVTSVDRVPLRDSLKTILLSRRYCQ